MKPPAPGLSRLASAYNALRLIGSRCLSIVVVLVGIPAWLALSYGLVVGGLHWFATAGFIALAAIMFIARLQLLVGGLAVFQALFRNDSSHGLLACVLWMVGLPTWLRLWVVLVQGHWQPLPLLLAVTVVLLPWATATRLLAPRGWVRAAYVVARLSAWIWRDDMRGGALVAACKAAIHHPPSTPAWSWIERKLSASKELHCGEILASALVAAHRGDEAGARQILHSLLLVERYTSPQAHRLALEWLAADAARHENWHEVARLGHSKSASRAAKLLGWIAKRHLTGDVPIWRIRLAWLSCGHLFATRSWVAHQLRRPCPIIDPPMPTRPSTAGLSPHHTALALHRWAQGTPQRLTLPDLVELSAAWERALQPEQMVQWSARASALGLSAAPRSKLIATVESDLTDLIAAAPITLGEAAYPKLAPPLLQSLSQGMLSMRLSALEQTLEALQRRCADKRALTPIEEWREWAICRAQYDQICINAALHTRRSAFAIVHSPLCSMACWLFNERKQWTMANTIFRWLLSEAQEVDDAEAIALQRKNSAC